MQLRASLAFLQWREALDIGDDFVPHLKPEQGVTVFASAFGCPVRFFDHTLPWAHPLIKEGDAANQVYKLPHTRSHRWATGRDLWSSPTISWRRPKDATPSASPTCKAR